LLGLVLITATLLILAPFSAGDAAACSFSGPMPTPPVTGADWGSDCNWHLDGKVYPGFEGIEMPSQYYTFVEDGDYWIPRGAVQAESEEQHDAPLAIILPAAIILPLAVLIIGALMRPRGGGH
jgi:hypothetical protein